MSIRIAMSNDFQTLDILLFAMIAVFLALRLRSVLGRRDKNDQGLDNTRKMEHHQSGNNQNVIELPEREVKNNDESLSAQTSSDTEEINENLSDNIIQKELLDLKKIDPDFDPENFIVGARVAFEMVIKAFASDDLDTLDRLLSNEVYSNFVRAINERNEAGYSIADTLVGIKSAELVEAFLEGQYGNITVKFISEQIKVTKDKKGKVIDGDPKSVIVVVDFWTFSRDINQQDPNWILVATRSLD